LWVFLQKPAVRLALIALPCLAGVACSSAPSGDSGLLAKPSSFFATPDWMKDSGAKEGVLTRGVAPEELAGPDGACAGVAQPASGPEGEAVSQPPPVGGGIGLGLSECEVIRRAGAADQLEFGTNERGERTLTLTYLRGERPGIYRFRSGRLASIERGPEPPAPPKVAKPQPKPAAPKTAAVPRPQAPAQSAPRPQAPWPAAQQPQAAPQAAPQGSWPAPAQQSAPQAAPWPSSPAPQQQAPWPAPAR
jgi:hypothetical protein